MATQILEVPVIVGAEPMIARIAPPLQRYAYGGFRVQFSDGFTDEFVLIGEEPAEFPPMGSRTGWEPYAKAIRFDLDTAAVLQPGQRYCIWQYEDDDVSMNCWLLQEYPDQGRDCWYLYYKGYCRFVLVKDGGSHWKMGAEYSGAAARNQIIVLQAIDKLQAMEQTKTGTAL
jgi:hypothetical protein